MFKKIALGFIGVIALFLIYVAFQPADFHVSREIKIKAPAEVVFAHVNNLHKFDAWNPWSKIDPHAKQIFEGPETGVGASFSWEGNNEVGSGKMTIIESLPSSLVRMNLEFFKPFKGANIAEFTIKSENSETTIEWAMIGKSAFIPRIFCTLVGNMDKMIGKPFEKGLSQLKSIAESEVQK